MYKALDNIYNFKFDNRLIHSDIKNKSKMDSIPTDNKIVHVIRYLDENNTCGYNLQ